MRKRCADKNETFAWDFVNLSQAHLLECIYKLMGGDERLLRFIFDLRKPELRLAPEEILAESGSLSHGEQLLIRAALDLWCEAGHCSLGQALATWDDKTIIHFIQAICHRREIRQAVLHALIDDEHAGIPL